MKVSCVRVGVKVVAGVIRVVGPFRLVSFLGARLRERPVFGERSSVGSKSNGETGIWLR